MGHDTGMIDAAIARHVTDRTRMAVSDAPNAKGAITTFEVLERFEAGAMTTATACSNVTFSRDARIRFACTWPIRTIRRG